MNNGQGDDNSIGATLRTEQQELRAASYVLNHELIPCLLEENLNLCEETGPSYNKDMYDRQLSVKDDPDFPQDVEVNTNGREISVSQAHSLYKMSLLQIPGTKKYIRVDYIKVNPAYVFPKQESEKFFTAKDIELHRYNKINGVINPEYSAFDSEDEELTMTEMIKFGFDGYNYEFKKKIKRDGEVKVYLQIGQYDRENQRNKILRKSNEMSNLKKSDFNNIRDTGFKAIEKARMILDASN